MYIRCDAVECIQLAGTLHTLKIDLGVSDCRCLHVHTTYTQYFVSTHIYYILKTCPPNQETRIPRYKFRLNQNLNWNSYRDSEILDLADFGGGSILNGNCRRYLRRRTATHTATYTATHAATHTATHTATYTVTHSVVGLQVYTHTSKIMTQPTHTYIYTYTYTPTHIYAYTYSYTFIRLY